MRSGLVINSVCCLSRQPGYVEIVSKFFREHIVTEFVNEYNKLMRVIRFKAYIVTQIP
jgi:hypothetical protein